MSVMTINDIKSKIRGTSIYLFVTATNIETSILHNYLKPIEGESTLNIIIEGNLTYFCGILGINHVVHVQCSMGAVGRDASLATIMEAIDCWKPCSVIMAGIAFGRDRKKQKIGDVLISESIVSYESQRVSKEGSEKRSPIPQCGKILLNRFKFIREWEFFLPNGRISDKSEGLILTGEKLVDNKIFKKELFGLYPNAIGGEMEAYGVYTACESKGISEWIVVKGICDWADGNKSRNKKANQEIAAEAAMSLCFSVFSNKVIGNSANNVTKKKLKKLYTANKLYEKSFNDVLFLHIGQESSKVRLSNLFVMQKYKSVKFDDLDEEPVNLIGYLSNFINNDTDNSFLFIEGDAGCGKSSLVAYLCYNYEINRDFRQQVFKDKELITIRLRDIITERIRHSGGLIQGILNYLQVKTISELESTHPNGVILLDGFDELCMIENMSSNAESLIYDIRNLRKYKLIITTRPKYIRIQSLDVRKRHIILQHFDSDQRNEWINKYLNVCEGIISDTIKEYLSRISDEDAFGICDTPMAIYMIVAGKIDNYALYNEWVLYNQIFYKELSETEYNSMFPNCDREYSHAIFYYRDIIYRISEEIAYKMYITGNSCLYLSDDELKEIIDRLGLADIKTRDLVKRCYALCSYWKANSDQGIIEFYHNNIRDFFLCEKIFRELNSIYLKFRKDSNLNLDEMINSFYSLFRFGDFETTVSKFILLRTLYKKRYNNQDEFPFIEYKNKFLPTLFGYIIVHGITTTKPKQKATNPIKDIVNVLSCIVQIFRHAYEPYLETGEYISWWHNPDEINDSDMLKMLFKYIFIKTPITLEYGSVLTLSSKSNFSKISFHSADIRNAGFAGSSLVNSIFQNAILCGVDFENANINNSDFTNADVHFARLTNANIAGCNFTGADLRGTELPDDYCSNIKEEQVEHLKSLNIKGVVV